ncbi:hypothetical protein F2Q69_00003205 [Brassica cretica]|uniref:Thioredoxin domain-containing protein n=1 Tax=Brassica cretica TaxID=69181 RepID=A0A8S9NXS9_BRACR|nr:hypothetical protein F2Q69_00003205 [Brassica cretica]
MKKTKRLQESISSDRIRLQPPSEKPKETKCLELMDNVEDRNMMRDSIPELLALHVLKHPIGSEPKPKEPLDGSHASPLSQQDRNMMRDSIPELLALPKLKHPIGSEPKPKEPLNVSPASPLSQQIETQVYSPNLAQHIEKEQLNEAPDAHTQVFSPNVTQQGLAIKQKRNRLCVSDNSMGSCVSKCKEDDDSIHNVDFSGGNVHLITTKESWDEKLAEAGRDGKIVIANFSATWCGPCKVVAPFYIELSEKHPSIMFLVVDVDELSDFSSSWDIKATPTFFFLKNGQQIGKLVGANKPELQKKVTSILDSVPESPQRP